jgi:ADP-heptose:LPS heptosyltransferase
LAIDINSTYYECFMQEIKSIEVFFRRFLVRALKLIVKRRRPLPPDFDFNRCKFLFVRQDRIGDVIVSTPLFTTLKKHYHGAVVDFLLSSRNHFVLENDPAVRKRWVYTKTTSNAIGLIVAIRREKYDFVIDLMDNPSATSTFICVLANASWTVGLCKENAYAYDIPIKRLSPKDTHIVDRTAQVLTAFRIDPAREKLKLHYHMSKESALFAESFLQKAGLQDKPIFAVNVSPAHGIKYWGKENYITFVKKVVDAYPSLAVLILFEPSDRQEAEGIVQPLNKVVLSPETRSFDQFAALLKHAAFLLTPDTSAVHLASAFQIPTVALYFQPDKEIKIWEPYGVDSETLVSARNGLQAITASDVFSAFERLYKRRS